MLEDQLPKKPNIWGNLSKKRRNEVLTYLRTGKASPEFLDYLDKHEDVDRKIDKTLEKMVNALRELPPFPSIPSIRVECSSCGTERPNKCSCQVIHITLMITFGVAYLIAIFGLIFLR